jgi:hypothetical protein
VTKSDKNIWQRFCVVGGGDSVLVVGQILFFVTHRHTHTHRHTDTQLKLLRDTGHKVDANLAGDFGGDSMWVVAGISGGGDSGDQI